jgi:hypothetical protein
MLSLLRSRCIFSKYLGAGTPARVAVIAALEVVSCGM